MPLQTCSHFRGVVTEHPGIWHVMLSRTYGVAASDLPACLASVRAPGARQRDSAPVPHTRRNWSAAKQLLAALTEARAGTEAHVRVLAARSFPQSLPTGPFRNTLTLCLENLNRLTARPFPERLQSKFLTQDAVRAVIALTSSTNATLSGLALSILANCLEARSDGPPPCNLRQSSGGAQSVGRPTGPIPQGLERKLLAQFMMAVCRKQPAVDLISSQFDAVTKAGSRALLNAWHITKQSERLRLVRPKWRMPPSTPAVQLQCPSSSQRQLLAPGLWTLALFSPVAQSIGNAPTPQCLVRLLQCLSVVHGVYVLRLPLRRSFGAVLARDPFISGWKACRCTTLRLSTIDGLPPAAASTGAADKMHTRFTAHRLRDDGALERNGLSGHVDVTQGALWMKGADSHHTVELRGWLDVAGAWGIYKGRKKTRVFRLFPVQDCQEALQRMVQRQQRLHVAAPSVGNQMRYM